MPIYFNIMQITLMKHKIRSLTIFFLLISCGSAFSQTAALESIASAKWLKDRRYRLTENIASNFGAVWSTQKISLNAPFDLLAKVNLGDKNNDGADGIAFSFLTQKGFANLANGEDFGISGLSPALSVEIDTYSDVAYNDPNNDHIAIQKNGNFSHGTPDALAGPINALAGSTFLNIEDGNDHFLRITWNPVAQNMKVFFDCQERLSLDYDIIGGVFGNDEFVYWGFSAGTGDDSNIQEVEVVRCSALDNFSEKVICNTASPIKLSASYGNAFNWGPVDGLDSVDIREPSANISKTTTYIAIVDHFCLTDTLRFQDTVLLRVPNLMPPNWKSTVTSCEDKMVILNAEAPDAKRYQWDSTFVLTPTFEVKKSGVYSVSITDGNCVNKVSSMVTIHPVPYFNLGKDQQFCDNTSLVLDPRITSANYSWSTGETTQRLFVTASGTYALTIKDAQNCSFADTINVVVKPSSRVTESKSICREKPFVFQGVSYSIDTTLKAVFAAANTCDSIYTLKLQVLKNNPASLDKGLCGGAAFDFLGKQYSAPGFYKIVLPNSALNGCDSVINLTLRPISTDTTRKDIFICKDSVLNIGGQLLNKSGVYTLKFQNSTGCDSILLVNLTVDPGTGFALKDTICSGQTYTFFSRTLQQEGVYTERLRNRNGCDSVVTLNLFVRSVPVVKISASKQYLCYGEQATLTADGTFLNYRWSYNNFSTNSIVVADKGWYRVSVSDDAACTGVDSFQIFSSPPITLFAGTRPPSCNGFADGQITLDSISGGTAPFTTSLDGIAFSSDRLFKGLKEGKYTITVRDSFGCTTQISENLVNPAPKRININEQLRVIALGDSTLVSVIPTFTDVGSVVWSPSTSVNPDGLEAWLKPLKNTFYTVVVKDSIGCEFKDTINVLVDSRVLLFVPNIFSANSDGTNDILRLHAGSSVDKIISFRVFDRWGVMVFEALDYYPTEDIGWDGSFKGKPQTEGVYISHVKVLKKNGETEDVTSEVLLIR